LDWFCCSFYVEETTGKRVSTLTQVKAATESRSLHGLGVVCGLTAGVWLGAAEAPTKLVTTGFSPFSISLCMVGGVFIARWTFPTLLKGTKFVIGDLAQNKHLVIWAVLAGSIWAVANTLTIFAIRDVGLAVAFPLWNTNSLVGLILGLLLFNELKGASGRDIAKVVFGAVAILAGAVLLGFSTMHADQSSSHRAMAGIAAALGASLLWGTMYVPYRKAYVSGMNPLSFVTVFTIGELLTVFLLVLGFEGGLQAPIFHSAQAKPMLFWLFLGGFAWVIGDIFQQFATKYIGIGRGIPLSNTNQLWGLAWGALVFGELTNADRMHKILVVCGSAVMILGVLAISAAVATERERTSTDQAAKRECDRYGLSYERVLATNQGSGIDQRDQNRAWWDYCIMAAAVGVFAWLAKDAAVPALKMDYRWLNVLLVVLVVTAVGLGRRLWKATRFS
jgi:glucose uptake protein GlcU